MESDEHDPRSPAGGAEPDVPVVDTVADAGPDATERTWGWRPPATGEPTVPDPGREATGLPPRPEEAPRFVTPSPAPSAPEAALTAADARAAMAAGVPSRGGARSAFLGGIAGALVGALVAGGLVVAFDDDPEPSATTQPSVRTAAADDATDEPRAPVVERPGDIGSILDAVRPAVVRIDVGGFGGREGTGTGFIVDASGVIVTNAHVVGNADDVTVHLADGTELEGEVVGANRSFDLAVVEVDGDGLPTVALGDSDQLEVGDDVVAIGNALGLSEGSGATVTTGIISGLDRVVSIGSETLFNAIQTDAAINPGNSGGPLVDMNGRVIGINTAIASPDTSNNVGFAISSSSARPIIEALRAGEEPQVAFLGVSTETVTAQIAEDVGVERGAVVVEVTPGSAADDAGIDENDVIVEVAGESIDDFVDVASAIRRHQPGEQIDVVLFRDGEEQSITVTLGERPDQD